MKKLMTKILFIGLSILHTELAIASQKFEDGCEIERTAVSYKVKDGAEQVDFSNNKTAKFDHKTGEVVVEFSGLATDGNKERSWAEAVFAPKGESPAHFHRIGTEFYYITKGNPDAFAVVDGVEHQLLTNTFLKILPNQLHSVENRSKTEGLVLLVKCRPSWAFEDHNLINKK